MSEDRVIEKFKESPFRQELVIPEGTKLVKLMDGKESKLSLVASGTGEEHTLFSFTKRKVDKEEFIKYYTNTIAIQHSLGLAGRRALDVLQWALQRDGIDRDWIWLGGVILDDWNERPDIEKKISKSAWYRGISDLIEKRVIARMDSGRQGDYWCNPSILFNGKRQVVAEMIELDDSYIEGEVADDGGVFLTADKQNDLNI